MNSDGLRDDLYRTRQQLAEREQDVVSLRAEVKALRADLRNFTSRYEAMANEVERLKLLVDQK